MAKQTKQAAANTPAPYDWSQAGNAGFENVQREDLGIPFLAICDAKSPEFDRTSKDHQAKKIEGIQPGDVFNNLSREIYHRFGGSPLIVVPCSYERSYVEWKPRTSGGGLVKVHKDQLILNEATRNSDNQDILKNGNLLVTTMYFYLLALRGVERIPIILGMKGSQLKKGRFWLNLASGIKLKKPNSQETYTPPFFSHSYKLSSVPENNEKGSFFGWQVAVHEMLSDPMLIADAADTSKKAIAAQRAALPSPAEPEEDVPYA